MSIRQTNGRSSPQALLTWARPVRWPYAACQWPTGGPQSAPNADGPACRCHPFVLQPAVLSSLAAGAASELWRCEIVVATSLRPPPTGRCQSHTVSDPWSRARDWVATCSNNDQRWASKSTSCGKVQWKDMKTFILCLFFATTRRFGCCLLFTTIVTSRDRV